MRIVVGFDDSRASSEAVRWAAREALRRGATLAIVSAFLPEDLFATREESTRLMGEVAERALAEARQAADGVVTELQEFEDLPVPVLLREAASADLLVVGSRGRGGFTDLLLGSVARQCVHRSPIPVAVIHGDGAHGAALSPDGASDRSVVVGVDGSAGSLVALRWAAEEATAIGCALAPLHVWHWPISYGWASIPENWDPSKDATVVLDEAVALVRSLHPTLEITPQVIEGWPAQVLTHHAAGAEMLVVGSRGHGELTEILIGSVSEFCVSHAPGPVVVMHGAHRSAEA